jgi:UDP-N-acetylmuramoyl-L-alanyl-D-glutamate--2,6-diaminopimelate ligase
VDGLRPTDLPPRRLAAVAGRLGVDPPPGAADVPVTGVCLQSAGVRDGDLYVGLRGSRTHGARFAGQAAQRGAVAVLTDPEGTAYAGEAGLPVLVVDDPRGVLGDLAGWVYGEPAGRLLMLGVTGTNGKTTTTFLLDSALRHTRHATGLVGTVEVRVGDLRLASVRTTPEATDLHALLAVMLQRGATACSMEVSSHALAMHRVDGVVFDVAGFTNLSQDHLDFHGSMEEYFATKASLFTPARSRRGVVCVDDAWGRRLAAESGVPVQTLATGPDPAPAADWVATTGDADAAGTGFELHGPDGLRLQVRSPIPGGFNVANTALCLAMLAAAGVDPRKAADALAGAEPVPGRMEVIVGEGVPGEPVCVVDYAHTPQAVEVALAALRPATPGRLVAVLGAGGDRDREKRWGMGAAAAREADVVVVTDDNPRSEAPAAIRAALLDGARPVAADRGGTVLEIGDRRAAMAEAVRLAWGEPRGAVLVAGKGHEQGQEIAGTVWPFDDREVLREALSAVSRRQRNGPGKPGR